MRRVVTAGAVMLALLAAWPVTAAPRRYRMSIIACTDQRAGLVGANARRSRILLWNLSAQTVFLGGEPSTSGDHVGGTSMWPLHTAISGSGPQQNHVLALLGGGQIECVVPNTTLPATAHIGVLEEIE